MDPNTPTTSWHPLRKAIFRFFFIFFALEIIVNHDFYILTFGINREMINLGQKIFTPPFLWLNDHIFHFNYNPIPGYFTFTYSLISVRHITYLGLAFIGSLV